MLLCADKRIKYAIHDASDYIIASETQKSVHQLSNPGVKERILVIYENQFSKTLNRPEGT